MSDTVLVHGSRAFLIPVQNSSALDPISPSSKTTPLPSLSLGGETCELSPARSLSITTISRWKWRVVTGFNYTFNEDIFTTDQRHCIVQGHIWTKSPRRNHVMAFFFHKKFWWSCFFFSIYPRFFCLQMCMIGTRETNFLSFFIHGVFLESFNWRLD